MTSWSVYIEYGVTDVAPEVYSDLFENLIDHAPGVGPAPNGNLSLRLMIEADSAQRAATEALAIAGPAVRDLGMSDIAVGFEVVTEAELDRRQAEPLVPELAGLTEAAGILGVTKQRVNRLVETGYLAPVQSLAAGPVFVTEAVRLFSEKEHNRTIGRPVADLGLSATERALLSLLAASAGQAAPTATPELPDPSQVIAAVYDNARVRVHRGPHNSPLAEALKALSEHRLIRTRELYRAEQETGDPQDAVITVLPKGLRHAAASTAVGEDSK